MDPSNGDWYLENHFISRELSYEQMEHDGHQYYVVGNFSDLKFGYREAEHGNIEILSRYCGTNILSVVNLGILKAIMEHREAII